MNRGFLIPFPVLAGVMGLAYIMGDPMRTGAPSFDVAKAVAPMHVWGFVFLAGAVALSLALTLDSRELTTVALFVGGVIYSWWGSCFAFAAATDPHASLTGWAIHWCLALAHYYAAWRIWTR